MSCTLPHESLEKYLDGSLATDEALAVEQHVETCEHCQSVEIVEPAFGALLRDKLGVESARAALRARILAGVSGDAAAEATAGAPLAEVVDIRQPWYRRALASPWPPRMAMVATLLFLLLVPIHLLNQAPALAKAALTRHGCHAPSFGAEMQSCCTDLRLAVGDALAAPSEGGSVPSLADAGLDLVTATRCNFDNVVVNQIGYRGTDAHTFSLYISDQVTEQFMQLRTKSVDGVEQARHRLEEMDVTIWERDGLIYFWVGPHANPVYDTALAALMNVP